MQSWRELGGRVVYEGFRSIRKRKFELPNGEVAEFELLELFDSVAVLALTAAHEVILVREFRPGPMAVLLELPGGVVEIGQAPVEAAGSELLEETGYAGTLQEVGTLFKDAYAANTKHVFRGHRLPARRRTRTPGLHFAGAALTRRLSRASAEWPADRY